MKKVAIVSCDKWKNKITEDLLLEKELIINNIDAEIISWEDKSIDYSKYDCLILRSVWGYQDKYLEFREWLQMIKNKNILLLNHPDIIINNIQNQITHIQAHTGKGYCANDYADNNAAHTYRNRTLSTFNRSIQNDFGSHASFLTQPASSNGAKNREYCCVKRSVASKHQANEHDERNYQVPLLLDNLHGIRDIFLGQAGKSQAHGLKMHC